MSKEDKVNLKSLLHVVKAHLKKEKNDKKKCQLSLCDEHQETVATKTALKFSWLTV